LQRTAHIVSDASPPCRTGRQPHLEGDEKLRPIRNARLSRKACHLPLGLRMSCCGVVRRRILLGGSSGSRNGGAFGGSGGSIGSCEGRAGGSLTGAGWGSAGCGWGSAGRGFCIKRPLGKNSRRKAGPWWREGTKTLSKCSLYRARAFREVEEAAQAARTEAAPPPASSRIRVRGIPQMVSGARKPLPACRNPALLRLKSCCRSACEHWLGKSPDFAFSGPGFFAAHPIEVSSNGT
jgi:hypothetical protein